MNNQIAKIRCKKVQNIHWTNYKQVKWTSVAGYNLKESLRTYRTKVRIKPNNLKRQIYFWIKLKRRLNPITLRSLKTKIGWMFNRYKKQ